MKRILAFLTVTALILIRPVVADDVLQGNFLLKNNPQDYGWFQKLAGGEPPPSYMGGCGTPTPDHQPCEPNEKPVCWPSNDGTSQGPCKCTQWDPVSGAKLCN
ncbi:hypothetical protein [Pseudomonas sp.]|uniref:hypothetical protein n=1 Tax=Pseudomonas sp. TaxID=306 RepID=UPI00326567B0